MIRNLFVKGGLGNPGYYDILIGNIKIEKVYLERIRYKEVN